MSLEFERKSKCALRDTEFFLNVMVQRKTDNDVVNPGLLNFRKEKYKAGSFISPLKTISRFEKVD